MAKLTHRCSALELQHLIEAIYPEERRHLFTDRPWQGEGFRHWLNPKVICIEHYMPRPWSKTGGLSNGRTYGGKGIVIGLCSAA